MKVRMSEPITQKTREERIQRIAAKIDGVARFFYWYGFICGAMLVSLTSGVLWYLKA